MMNFCFLIPKINLSYVTMFLMYLRENNMKEKLGKRHLLMVIAMCGICASSVGVLLNSGSVFYTPIAEDLGVGRGTISMTMTICSIAANCISLFVPKILSKPKHLKPMILISAILVVGGTLLCSFANNLYMLYALNIIRGIGSGLTNFILATIMINNWIYTSHGLIVSIVLCFSGIPGAILSTPISSIISNFGWQFAYIVVGIILLLFYLPAIIFPLSLKPEEVGEKPFGFEQYLEIKESVPDKLVIKKEANVQNGRLKIVLILLFTTSVCVVAALFQHLSGYAESLGYSASLGAMLLSAANISNIVSKLIYGVLSDRIGTKKSAVLFASLSVCGMLLLMFIKVPVVMIISTLLYGCTLPNSATSISLITSDIFGLSEYSKIYPKVSFVGGTMNAIGVTLLGFLYDATQNYLLLIGLCIILQVIAITSVIQLYRINNKEYVQ